MLSRLHTLTPQQWQRRAQFLEAELEGWSVDELLRGERFAKFSGQGNEASQGRGFDPNQPRVPAGHPDGGQWTGDGRGGDGLSAFFDARGAAEEDFVDPTTPRVQFAASQITIDNSRALTGISRIDETTRDLSRILADTMQKMDFIPTWTPQTYGTAVHVAFGTAVRFAGLEGIGPNDVEHSFFDGGEGYHGQPGSIRTDVVLRNAAGTIIAIYDVKTGGAKLSESRIRQLRRKTGVGSNVPIIEIHILRGARLTRNLDSRDTLGTIIAQLGNRSLQGS